MSVHPSNVSAPFIFIIDTTAYSGNFEREMCAFLTGSIGDCGKGQEEADDFAENAEQFAHLTEMTGREADEHGCYRPVSIWTTPGRWNNGSGSHFDDSEWVAAPGKYKWPAYESVAIFFDSRPTREDIAFMKERADEFVVRHPKKFAWNTAFEIRGYRLVKHEVVVTDTEIPI